MNYLYKYYPVYLTLLLMEYHLDTVSRHALKLYRILYRMEINK